MRYFSGSGFGSALRHELRYSKSTAPKSSKVMESTKGLFRKKTLEMENLPTCKRSLTTASNSRIPLWVEAAHAAMDSATSAAKSAALAMAALRGEVAREAALAEHDLALSEEATADAYKRISLPKLLTEEDTADADKKISSLECLQIICEGAVATGAKPTIASLVEAAFVAQYSAASAAKSTALVVAAVKQEYAREAPLSSNDQLSSDLTEGATADADKKTSLKKSLPITKISPYVHWRIARLVEDANVRQVSAASAAKSAALAIADLRKEVVREMALAGHYEQFPYLALLEGDIADEKGHYEQFPYLALLDGDIADEDKKISLQKSLRSLATNPTIASLIDAAYLEQISAANATKSAASTISALRYQVAGSALGGHDQLHPALALLEEVTADEDKIITLQKVLTGLEMRFQYMELQKDPAYREKLPRALPSVEIETDLIACLLVKEPLIIFLEVPFYGERGHPTGFSSHCVFYTNNKGVPLRVVMGIRHCFRKRIPEPYVLESSIFDAEQKFPSVKYRIFSSRKSLVKSVQERMRRLKAGEKLSNDIYTKVAKALIAKGSTIKFIERNDIQVAGFLAYLAAKMAIEFIEVDLPYQKDVTVLNG